MATNLENPDTMTIGPALEVAHTTQQGPATGSYTASQGTAAADVESLPADAEGRFAAMAPYWQDGLHNFEGVALAREINKIIKEQKLEEEKEAIAKLLATYPKARGLGIEIVSESRYLNDPELKANLSEPLSILNGALVRDKDGGYRPKAGGPPVLQDLGASLVLKSKSAEAYRGAMELAVAKGWTAIELKGKPAMLAEAWLEAKLMGLNVVNYSPSELDRAKYAARLAEESQRKDPEHAGASQQAPEKVEVRPFIDANGQQKTATVTYTVTYQSGKNIQCDNAKGAAQAFCAAPDGEVPVVIRSLTRADGVVREDVVAGVDQGPLKGKANKVVGTMLDEEFDAAMAEVIESEKVAVSLKSDRAPVTTGIHIGPIVAIEGDRIAQKIGRDPSKVVWHTVSNLKGQAPKIGEMAEIGYSKGLGIVKGQEQARGPDLGRRGIER